MLTICVRVVNACVTDRYDAVKYASDEAEAELAKAQTGYSVALQSFLDQDRQLGAPLIDLVTEQINFHRTSLLVLEQMMPKLQQTYVAVQLIVALRALLRLTSCS